MSLHGLTVIARRAIIILAALFVLLLLIIAIFIFNKVHVNSNQGPQFDTYLSPRNAVSSVSNQKKTFSIRFLTDTVFPMPDNDHPEDQDIFKKAWISFADHTALATRVSSSVQKGEYHSNFPEGDSEDDYSSGIITTWQATLPQAHGLKNGKYVVLVTACTSDKSKCQQAGSLVCVKKAKIIGEPTGYGGGGYAPIWPDPSCNTPAWTLGDAYDTYRILDTGPVHESYQSPTDWETQPARPFNEPGR